MSGSGILRLSAVALLLLAQTTTSFSQSSGSKAFQRFYSGYSFPMTSATYSERYMYYDDYGDNNMDTTMSKNVRSKGGFGIVLGTYFPIVRLTERTSLNISLDFMYNFLVWDGQMVDPSTFNEDPYEEPGAPTTNIVYEISGATVQWGLPVGVDLKTGGESSLDRADKFSFTLGTGVYPTLNLTVFEINAGAKFKMQPYLKAELGFFAGINWKMRALYSFGKLDYISYSENYSGDTYAYQSDVSLISKSCLTLSLMVTPGSFKWGKAQWWR